MAKWALIADDLTGASDTGIHFVRKGHPTRVVFDVPQRMDGSASAACLAIDTDSRALDGRSAYERVRGAAERLKDSPYRYIYKKADSALRGNIGWELDALQDVLRKNCVFFAPAYPSKGRVTIDGIHYVHGVPVGASEMARDPRTPVVQSHLVRLLEGQTSRSCLAVPLARIRQPLNQFHAYIEQEMKRGTEIFAFDAETDEDLLQVGRLAGFYGSDCLMAGSAGLAQGMLARSPEPKIVVDAHAPASPTVSTAPLLIVAGSLSGVTGVQLARIRQKTDVYMVEMSPAALIRSAGHRRAEIERCLALICEARRAGKDICLYIGRAADLAESSKQTAEPMEVNESGVPQMIADSLGYAAAKAVDAVPLCGLIVTGGDTAKAACRHLHAEGLELLEEVEPGIPAGRLIGRPGVTVVTKAGAFGSQDAFINAIHYLKGGIVQ